MSKSALGDLSPVRAPTRDDLTNALDILNASIDSGLVRQMIQEVSPSSRNLAEDDDRSLVLTKCKSVLEDLQQELLEERKRSDGLERTLASLRENAELEKKCILSDHEKVCEKYGFQIRELTERVGRYEQRISEKEKELENMTVYCERRIDEMKKAVKEASSMASSVASAPTLDENGILELQKELWSSKSIIKNRETEMEQIVHSYEKQVSLLREQLKSNQDLIDRFVKAGGHRRSIEAEKNKWHHELRSLSPNKNRAVQNPFYN